MPLNTKGRKIMDAMKQQYGSKKAAKRVFYASKAKGTIGAVEKRRGTR